jgi:hypothetical protein
MSLWFRSVAYVCLALAIVGCGPRLSKQPARSAAQARNGEPAPKKKLKRPRPLVAPPPAYGNKIVCSPDAPSLASIDAATLEG